MWAAVVPSLTRPPGCGTPLSLGSASEANRAVIYQSTFPFLTRKRPRGERRAAGMKTERKTPATSGVLSPVGPSEDDLMSW